MRFRRLNINIQTSDGPYGTSIDFPNGLVVLWADNSMGKSTCVKAILIALGMEAMLSTSKQDLPLPPAINSKLDSETGEHAVIESEVFLEIENGEGRRIVVQRTTKGNRDKNLITVTHGPALTSKKAFDSEDYYLGRQGSATREKGFHHFLAGFLGWELPRVQTYDGNEAPLYLQCLFPFFVVEQTRGWSTVMPPIPNQFRIREAHKRAIEFMLNLDAHRVAIQRQALLNSSRQIEADWKDQTRRIKELAESIGGVVQAMPEQPIAHWPPQILPRLTFPQDDKWLSIGDRIQGNHDRLLKLKEKSIPRVEDVVLSTQSDLDQSERELQDKQSLLVRLLEAQESEKQEVDRLSERLSAIGEDIKRNKDVRTLKMLGSRENSAIDQGSCPVCHQHVTDSLLPLPADQAVMSLDENIEFLEEQHRTFSGLLSNSQRIAEARQQQVRGQRAVLSRLRERIRALRQTLVSGGKEPSIADVYARVETENLIRQDEAAAIRFDRLQSEFETLCESWKTIQADLSKLPNEDVTEADRAKLNEWSTVIRNHLAAYGFGSIAPSQITLSVDTYRPEHEGFDLQSGISASDLIRTIWSYLSGLMEMARTGTTNHPGCLLFDEPRQQSTRDVSFEALLRQAGSAGKYGQQFILFTSENRVRLERHLEGVEHTFVPIQGRLLKRKSLV